MTVTIKREKTKNGTTCKLYTSKEGIYTVIEFVENDDCIVNECDIINKRNYYSEKTALAAYKRIVGARSH